MKTYIALVHKDADSAFGVSFPDLPGCFSAADRMEDVLPNACEALDLWFEDADDVEPRSIEGVAAEVADDLAEGAFLIAVPLVSNEGKSVRVNLSLDRGVLDAIDAAAQARKLTRSAFLTEAARNEIQGAHRGSGYWRGRGQAAGTAPRRRQGIGEKVAQQWLVLQQPRQLP